MPSVRTRHRSARLRFPLASRLISIKVWREIRLITLATLSTDELRCYCNLPVCVTTGYMCKSAMGTCFTEIVDRGDLSKSRHGCLELLSR